MSRIIFGSYTSNYFPFIEAFFYETIFGETHNQTSNYFYTESENKLLSYCRTSFYNNISFFSLQTPCFGGLPDVTEHANRHPLTLREPSTNSESLDISTHQKAPLPSRSSSPTTPNGQQKEITKRKLNRKCGFCTCVAIFFLISCALIGILVIHFVLSDSSGDRESQEQRMKIVRRLLHETPLIGTYS